MAPQGATKLAIDLMHFPSQVRSVKSAPLPDDVVILLRIAAGDEEALRTAADSVGRSPNVVYEAAAFFIEQILLHPGADSYSVLGARPEAPYSELRRNMALLLKWLHPDTDPHGERVVFASRVTRAWNDLKTPERRASYDRSRSKSLAESSPRKRRRAGTTRWELNANSAHAVSNRFQHVYAGERGSLLHWILLLFGRGAQ